MRSNLSTDKLGGSKARKIPCTPIDGENSTINTPLTDKSFNGMNIMNIPVLSGFLLWLSFVPHVVQVPVLVWALSNHGEKPENEQPSGEVLPNLVILFADNLGYDDVSAFQDPSFGASNPRATPNIDHLAEQGMKFLNWNSAAALCSASRAALLTGRYPVRTGVYPRVFRNDATYGLLPEETTLAEILKVEGYATSIV